ncbi:SOS response-associated peptidase [Dehalobacter sp. DCM]|uniref:SOS response-associated peptidase n=1 Tax=Dehalobacter sp. DCM TaxID=2907827 RepID=UPI003081DEDB|nr:SOS response-associated peptidase [Dehalobacter sp. DCM]
MCGRITFTLTRDELAEIYKITDEMDWQPRYNIAPSQPVPVMVNTEAQQLKFFRWGLVPSWAKDPQSGYKMINARAETIDTKPSFKHCFREQRCLVLADGFYEWKREGKRKTPYLFKVRDRKFFAFAGIWDSWKSPAGTVLYTCSIITTGPNEQMAPIHDRMPVILDKENERIWLNPELNDTEKLKQLLVPYPAVRMEAYQVSDYVNSVKHDSIACIQPVPGQTALFG